MRHDDENNKMILKQLIKNIIKYSNIYNFVVLQLYTIVSLQMIIKFVLLQLYTIVSLQI